MTGKLNVLRAFALAITLLFAAGAERAAAVAYKATIIHPMGYDDSVAKAISGTSILGQGDPSAGTSNGIAFLIDDSTHNVVNLNPDGWYVQPEDVSGDSQVGDGPGPTTGGNPHAVLWHGTPESLVDLNPAGFDSSYAFGVSGNNQVGFGAGIATGFPFHALLWHGTPESVVDLNPAGFAASIAFRAFGDNIVGYGGNNGFAQNRALLWQGAAHTVVNLHPAQYPETIANDVSADSQVGQAIFSSNVGGERHALLWHGTAASVIDLNPSGFFETGANAVAGALQVGYGQGTATGGQQHALLWAGSAASVVDLNSFLVGLSPSFVGSDAYDIDASGVIVGSAVAAVDGGYVGYAVKWTPVPEPSSLETVVCGLALGGIWLLSSFWPLVGVPARSVRVDRSNNSSTRLTVQQSTPFLTRLQRAGNSCFSRIETSGRSSSRACSIKPRIFEVGDHTMIQSNSAPTQQKWASRRFRLPTDWRGLLGWGAVSLGLALAAGSASAQSTTWTNSSLGNWFIASNWSNGVPGAGPDLEAVISNGGTALINAGSFASYSGGLDVGGPSGHGSVVVDGGATLRQFGSIHVSTFANISGSVDVSGNGSYWGVNGPIDLSGSGTFTVENGADVLSAQSVVAQSDIEGNSLATVTGAGSTWAAGALKVGGAGALRIYDHALVQTNSLRVANTASVEVNNGDSTVAGLVVASFGGNLAGALGSLAVGNTANGRMNVVDGGGVVNSIGTIGRGAGRTGAVTVDGYGSSWDNSSDVVVGESGVGTLAIQQGATVTSLRGHLGFNPGASGSVVVADPGSTWTASGSLFIGNGGNGSLQVLNGGVATTAGNSYLGFSAGAAGSAIVSGAGSTWNTTATLAIGGNLAASGGSGYLQIENGGAVNTGSTILYSTGEVALRGATTFTGPITSYGGAVHTFSDTALTNNVTLGAGGIIVVSHLSGSTTTFSGAISGSGGLAYTGLGAGATLRLTGNNTYTGETIVNSGRLVVEGSITSPLTLENGAILDGSGAVGEVVVKDGGVVAPGNSPGLLTTGNATFQAGGAYLLDLRSDGTGAAGTDWDSLAVNGTLDVSAISETNPFIIRLQTLDASNNLNYLDLWDRNVSHTWESVLTTLALGGGDFDARSFEVDTTGFQNPINGTFSLVQDGTNFNLQYDANVSTTLDGDYNGDGVVDAADYTVWRDTLGQAGSGLAADGTGPAGVPDGVVDQLDYDFWKANFGNHSGTGAGATAAVPEPSTLWMLLVAAASVSTQRRWCAWRVSKLNNA